MLEQYETFVNLNMELSTKIEQLETSANTNNCTINDEQLVKKKKKLVNSQDAYKRLLAKMETMCKYCDELTNKVPSLEAFGSTPTEAHKKEKFYL